MADFHDEPRRDLTLAHATSLVVGIIVGTGIFLKSATMAQETGTPVLVLAAWVVAGLVALFGALSFAELSALLPRAGGEYVYLREAYGEVPGFLYVFNSFLIGGASLAAYGAAAAIFLGDIYPLGEPWIEHTLYVLGEPFRWQLGPLQAVAVAIILVFMAINCAGVAIGGRVQTILTSAKVTAILAVIGGAFFASGSGDWSNLAPEDARAGGGSGFATAVFAALWAYSGWQYLPMAASEVRDPERNLPRAIIGGTLLVLGLYLLVNLAFLYALPFTQVATANSTAHPDAPSVAARAVQSFLGPQAAAAAALVFLISTIGSLNGALLGRARVPYAAARDGLFFSRFGRLHPRSRVPAMSVVLVSLWAVLLALSGTFDQLTNMSVLSYAVFWIPVALAVIVLRRRNPQAIRHYRTAGYPWVPLLFAGVMLWIVVNAFVTSPIQSFATLALILLGLAFYPIFRARERPAATRAPTS